MQVEAPKGRWALHAAGIAGSSGRDGHLPPTFGGVQPSGSGRRAARVECVAVAEPIAQREYQDRLRAREAERARLESWDRRLSHVRVAVVALALALAWPTLISQTLAPGWILAPAAVFLALVPVHWLVARKRDRRRLGLAFYRRGLARMSGDRADPLDEGSGFAAEAHPYAEDLDLFGSGSLYALLCTARSLPGRRALAEWLTSPAGPEEIAARQEAIAEVRGRLELQEAMAVAAADLSPEIEAGGLDEWGSGPRRLSGRLVPLAAGLIALVNLVVVGAWLLGTLSGRAALPLLAIGGLLALVFRSRVAEVFSGLSIPAGELRFFADALDLLEGERFEAALLRDLQRRSGAAADRPSARLLELARLIEWNDSRRNLFFAPLASLLLLGVQLAFAVERWRGRDGPSVGGWLRAIGEFEALSSLATFAFENPDYAFPEVVEGGPVFVGDDLAHPLLPRGSRVANSVQLGGEGADGPTRLLLISGSNMSGKSTLLRTVGIAAVLAQAGAPVPARRLRLTPLAVGASIQLHDSLLEGYSRFYAELRRLRQIRDLAASGPTLFLLDEILHGTNSHDRRLGAAGVVRGLLDTGALGLVTTHDLALAEIADELAPTVVNVHFEDHLEEGRMAFDYRLRPGTVARGNALALMRSLGLPVGEP